MRLSFVVRFAVLAAVLCIVGCNSNNKGKLEGTKWSSQAFTPQGGKLIAAGMITFEFTTSGQVTYKIVDQSYTGRYTLNAGDYVTLHLDQPLAGSRTHRQRIIVRGTTMQLIDTDGTSITFDKTP
jgi:hypothetical protein